MFAEAQVITLSLHPKDRITTIIVSLHTRHQNTLNLVCLIASFIILGTALPPQHSSAKCQCQARHYACISANAGNHPACLTHSRPVWTKHRSNAGNHPACHPPSSSMDQASQQCQGSPGPVSSNAQNASQRCRGSPGMPHLLLSSMLNSLQQCRVSPGSTLC